MESEININGYKTLRSNSYSRHTGGIIVYVRNPVQVNIICNHVEGNDNVLIFDVVNSPCRGRWCTVYHSPNSSHATFIDKLESLLQQYVMIGQLLYICGDFNINMHANNNRPTYKNKLIELSNSLCLKQLVKRYTRVTQLTRSIIDLLFTNDVSVKVLVSDDYLIADHKTILIKKQKVRRDYDMIKITDRSKINFDSFTTKLKTKVDNLSYDTSDVNTMATVLHESIELCATELTVVKMATRSYSKRWFTQELKDLRRKELNTHTTAQILNDDASWAAYRQTRNIYNKKLNEAKTNSIKNVFINYKEDKTKLWKELKQIFNDKTNVPDFINFDNQLIADHKLIANKFNIFFIESIETIHASVPLIAFELPPPSRNIIELNSFKLVNKNQICDTICDIKKKTGLNNVNKEILKMSMNVCGDAIVDMFNKSISEGIFPDIWKCTVVQPIPKVHRTNKSDEFRPINMTATMDKVLQTIIKNQLEKHLHDNEILSEYQSAFRGQHSCETAINLILVKWKEAIMNKKKIVAVFLDLKRAFETVDREILCKILYYYGVKGITLKWFESWLNNRKQKTIFNNECSETKINNIGIPQGTPLSCILFVVYINVIVSSVRNCKINLFADDTLLWVEDEDQKNAFELLNADLKLLSNCLNMLKLKLNTDKTKYMCIGFDNINPRFCVKINDCDLSEVTVIKYLGVMIDNKLNFNKNIEYLIKKIYKKIAYLGRNRKKMDQDMRLNFVTHLIAPHTDYCSSVLLLANDAQIDRLQKQQNRCLRIILREEPRANVHTMLNKLSMLDICQRIHFNVLVIMFKCFKKELPKYLCEHFINVSDVQPYNLRGNDLLRLPAYRTTGAQNSLKYKGAQMFNLLKSQYPVNNNTSLKDFKNSAVEFVKRNYASHRIPTV